MDVLFARCVQLVWLNLYKFSHTLCLLQLFFFLSSVVCYLFTSSDAGLLLYAVDLVLRSGQLGQTTLITGAAVDDEAGVATVQLQVSQVLCGC